MEPNSTTTTAAAAAAELVQVSDHARIETVAFAVPLPDTIYQGWDEPAVALAARLSHESKGIVGTIVFMKKSAMVWFGWGELQPVASAEKPSTGSVGQATNLSMGPLIVAMPRMAYRGAFADSEPSTSKLIGSSDAAVDSQAGDNSDDADMIGRQMASRLSQRAACPVLVSCSFAGAPAMARQGVDQGTIQQRAAALAEREIGRLLLAHQHKN